MGNVRDILHRAEDEIKKLVGEGYHDAVALLHEAVTFLTDEIDKIKGGGGTPPTAP